MSDLLLKKIDESTKKLETEIQNIIDDFEAKTKTMVLLSFEGGKVIVGLAYDIDKSTL